MQRSILAIGALLVAAGALWWLWPEPGPAPVPAAPDDAGAGTAAAPAAGAPAAAAPLAAAPRGAPAPGPAAGTTSEAAGSAVGRLPDALRPWRRVRDPLARPGPRREAAARSWDRHLAPLVHPPGHPRAGRFRDGVELAQATTAVETYLDEVHADDAAAHVPLLQLERKLTLADASELTPGLDWRLRDDRVRIYEILRDTEFENPDAPLRPFTFLAPPEGHPDAITRAEFERRRALEAVREQLAPGADAASPGE